MKGFADPNVAMKMRDVLKRIISEEIRSQVPEALYGTVLRVDDSGPEFPVAPSGLPVDTTGYPPESSGNPRQLAYATVRLDNGEEISVRCHENAPVARVASFYDPLNPAGEVDSVLIYNGVYRYAQLATVVDQNGVSVQRIQPDLTRFMPNEPYVPPRVQVRGRAGRYYLDGILRGLAESDGALIDNSFLVGRRLAGKIGGEISAYSSEEVYNTQGWVSGSAYDYRSGFDIELSYGGCWQKYIIPPTVLNSAPWDTWMVVPPVYENAAPKNDGYPSDVVLNALLIHIQGGSIVNFFIANRTLSGYSVASDFYLGGYVVVRSLNGELAKIPGIPLPTGWDQAGSRVLGFYDTSIAESTVFSYSRPAGTTILQSDLAALKSSITGGGRVTLVLDASNKRRLKWTSRFVCVTAKSPYNSAGFYDINMPSTGTVISVFGVNPGDGSDPIARDVTSDGIDVTGTGGLYYVLPIGGGTSGFVWVGYNSFFDIPANWVRIWSTNSDGTGADGKLCTGRELSYWRDCSLSQGFIQHSSQPAQFKVENGALRLRGAIINNSGSTKTNITLSTFIPSNYAPTQYYIAPFLLLNSSGSQKSTSRNDIGTGGNFYLKQSVDDGDQIFFDGHVITL